MNKENGITIMNLVITIIVMIILISVSGYYSLDSIKNSYIANQKRELSNVVDYVSVLKSKLLIDEFLLDETTVVTEERLNLIESYLSSSQINYIIEVNISTLDPKYKYHYITSSDLADKTFSNSEVNVKDAKYNYIINFYTGTVIAIYDSSCEVSGIVKGLADILAETNENLY